MEPFLIRCECGVEIRVSAGQAGAEILCDACGRATRVPSLGRLRADPDAAPFRRETIDLTAIPDDALENPACWLCGRLGASRFLQRTLYRRPKLDQVVVKLPVCRGCKVLHAAILGTALVATPVSGLAASFYIAHPLIQGLDNVLQVPLGHVRILLISYPALIFFYAIGFILPCILTYIVLLEAGKSLMRTRWGGKLHAESGTLIDFERHPKIAHLMKQGLVDESSLDAGETKQLMDREREPAGPGSN